MSNRLITNGEGRGSERMRAASVRAFDAYASTQRRANQILEELDEVTEPHGVPTVELDDEDSIVTTTAAARGSHEETSAVAHAAAKAG